MNAHFKQLKDSHPLHYGYVSYEKKIVVNEYKNNPKHMRFMAVIEENKYTLYQEEYAFGSTEEEAIYWLKIQAKI
jgi:hypothetical protein